MFETDIIMQYENEELLNEKLEMPGITYGLVEEHYFLNGTQRTSYGIAAYFDAEHDGTLTIVASLHDVTSVRADLVELIKRCNDHELSLRHLEDVIEDFLAG